MQTVFLYGRIFELLRLMLSAYQTLKHVYRWPAHVFGFNDIKYHVALLLIIEFVLILFCLHVLQNVC